MLLPSRFLNRELSQLEFQRRVLSMAEDPELPLLERLKFVAISSQILDEFFQIRVAGLKQQLDAGVGAVTPEGLTPASQLRKIRREVLSQNARRMDLLRKRLFPELAERGLHLVGWDSLSREDRDQFDRLFYEQIFPVLTPLSVDPAHPFPYISNLSFNLAVALIDPSSGETRFARLKVPSMLPRFYFLPDGKRVLPIEQLMASHLEALFPSMEIISVFSFRVTRDAELSVEEDEAEDLLHAIQSSIARRRRMNDVVRLEIDIAMSDQVRELLVRELDIDPDDVYVNDGLLALGGLMDLYSLDRSDLKYVPWKPDESLRSRESESLFDRLRETDILVHHPYESFESSVESFLSEASRDPKVLAIKNTVYRTTSGPKNPIVRALTRAAQAGKEVVALIELKARFDEEANIEWARELERAGVHVVYGLVGLKTHAKASLIVRQEGDRIRRYCHVGTGNYNAQTASIYEDVGLLSSNPALADDLSQLFNYLTGFARPSAYSLAQVAPTGLREFILEQIREETRHPDGHVIMKINGISDPEMIDALYAASNAGVEIDLIVRSVCCLRPAVPGLSERIRVRSVLGRYLEHSRIFRFGSDARGPRYLIGSADMMTRNLSRRVELLVPVEQPELRDRLQEILDANLSPDAKRWELAADGQWTRWPETLGRSSQEILYRLARRRRGAIGNPADV